MWVQEKQTSVQKCTYDFNTDRLLAFFSMNEWFRRARVQNGISQQMKRIQAPKDKELKILTNS
jgi:hypothetical protein